MTPRVLAVLAALGVFGFACMTRPVDPRALSAEPLKTAAPEAVRVAAPTRSDDKPVIVSLELRDETLRVTSSGAGPRFLVERSDGVVIARELGDAELRELRPELYDLYRSGYASTEPYLDATRPPAKPTLDSRVSP